MREANVSVTKNILIISKAHNGVTELQNLSTSLWSIEFLNLCLNKTSQPTTHFHRDSCTSFLLTSF
jgi:hypothetical protein